MSSYTITISDLGNTLITWGFEARDMLMNLGLKVKAKA